jgi:hypothetical protein
MIADIIHKVAEISNGEETPFYPRPSMAGPDRCIRQMVYHGLNFPREPLPGRAVVIFSDSSFHEDLTADWIRKTSYQLHSEQMKVKCRKPMTSGHIDGIITDLLKIDRLWEHKALNHFSFQRYWGGELPNDYLTQCAIYIDAIQTNDNPDLKEGLLLIKNKNTAQYMEYLIGYESDILYIFKRVLSTGEEIRMDVEIPNIVNDACDKFIKVLGYIENKTLPKRQYHINDDWQCEYCGWAKTCWEGYEKEFNELVTQADLPNEIADTVRYYKELGAQKSDIKKEYEALSKRVKDIMKEAGAREGRAGEYICRIKLVESARIDKDLLNPAEIERATVKGFQERLYISQIKEVQNA